LLSRPVFRCPVPEDLARLVVHGKEALDAYLLQGDVLRRAKGGEGREQIERDLALREPHRQNGEGLDTQDLMEAKINIVRSILIKPESS